MKCIKVIALGRRVGPQKGKLFYKEKILEKPLNQKRLNLNGSFINSADASL
jgi:hypothetical protein